MSACAAIDMRKLERQIQRIRGRLLDAWDRRRSERTIRRLEGALRDRWRLLDEQRIHL